MNDLFPVEESLSPRLAWMKELGILTHYNPDCEPPWIALKPIFPEHKGMTIGAIMADACLIYDESGWIGEGDGEADAMADLALKLGLKLWNEAK